MVFINNVYYKSFLIRVLKSKFDFVVIFQGLKSHAVTMFEVGKLLDESIDGFLSELEKVIWNSVTVIYTRDTF